MSVLVCAICGGPRTPFGLGGKRARDQLIEARKSDRLALRRRAAAIGLASLAVVSLLLMLVVASIAPDGALAANVVAWAATSVIVIAAAKTFGRAARFTRDADRAIDAAWLAAAEDVAARSHGVTASELSERLGIESGAAERLLSLLSVEGRTRVDVGEDAELRYSLAAEARIDDDAPMLREDELEPNKRVER